MTVASYINGEIGAKFNRVDAIVAGVTPALPFTPGYAVSGNSFSDWVYVQAGSGFSTGTAVVDGTVVVFDGTFTASLTNGTGPKIGQFIGVIRFADTIAQGNGFWVQVCGQANILVAASATANTFLSTTTTAGVLGSAKGTGTTMLIQGIAINSANGGSQGAVEGTLNYPMVQSAN